jgi:ribonuclease HI
MKEILAYTDGSAVVAGKSKGKGGFAAYFPDLFGKKKAYSLGFRNTKTGEMEVTALLYAVRAMPRVYSEPVKLIVYSDSEYVVKSFTERRLERWIEAGWRNSSGIVKNLELWKSIVKGLEQRRGYLRLEMRHIRSHQVEKAKNIFEKKNLLNDPNIQGNMVADRLADYKRHKELLTDITKLNEPRY